MKRNGEWNSEGRIVANRLKQMRALFGETQEELSQALHISRSCLANYENCRRKMPRDILEQVALHFGVQESFLLGRTSHIIPEGGKNATVDISDALTHDGKLDIGKIPLSGRLALITYYQYLRNPSGALLQTEHLPDDEDEKKRKTY